MTSPRKNGSNGRPEDRREGAAAPADSGESGDSFGDRREDAGSFGDLREDAAAGESAYDLYQRGMALVERRDGARARLPLEQAKRLEPNKPSIAEALGRAYFYAGDYEKAAGEFEELVERYPVNDFAQFCLGRSLQKLGRIKAARRHFAIAAELRPDRSDYRRYRLMLGSREP